jgi:hypothetical protein
MAAPNFTSGTVRATVSDSVVVNNGNGGIVVGVSAVVMVRNSITAYNTGAGLQARRPS